MLTDDETMLIPFEGEEWTATYKAEEIADPAILVELTLSGTRTREEGGYQFTIDFGDGYKFDTLVVQPVKKSGYITYKI